MGTLLANSQRLMALSFGAVIAGDGHGQQQTEVLRRMTLAMARDVRVVMVRLASALQSLRHVAGSSLPDDMMVPLAHGRMPGHEARGPNPVDDGAAVPANVLGLAQEAMQVLAPLANRLGLYRIKWLSACCSPSATGRWPASWRVAGRSGMPSWPVRRWS